MRLLLLSSLIVFTTILSGHLQTLSADIVVDVTPYDQDSLMTDLSSATESDENLQDPAWVSGERSTSSNIGVFVAKKAQKPAFEVQQSVTSNCDANESDACLLFRGSFELWDFKEDMVMSDSLAVYEIEKASESRKKDEDVLRTASGSYRGSASIRWKHFMTGIVR